MSREHFQRVDRLYQLACDLPIDQREAFLSRECAGDGELFEEVRSLLAHDEAASSEFLEEPAFVSPNQASGTATIPGRIGHYHLKSLIASGGMGTVYAAVQEHPRRAVAVKIMKHGIASRSALRRFEFESQVLARLRHPGIAQVYEAGTHDDGGGAVPFFAMEYIPNAKSITQYAVDAKLSTRERLTLFIHTCDAVHHGHQKGVIHRDLKPGNVLVDTQGQVKVIDFGVARCTDSDLTITTLQTDIGQLIGTLQYMSPEQCESDPTDIDSRSDVYALGVVLYELLTEQLPYDVRQFAMHQATQVIREQKPAKPSTLKRALRGDIETIAMKALEKDRARRYQSATDLAQDIQRYLNGEAILARPPSLGYQLQVFARRNKAVFAAIAAVFVVLVGASIVSLGLYLRADRARVEATQERVRAVAANDESQAVTKFLSDMLTDVEPDKLGKDVSMRKVLDAASERIAQGLGDKPLIEARLRETIGSTYLQLGFYDQAGIHLAAAVAIYQHELGPEHAATLASKNNLANNQLKLGQYTKAEETYREMLEVRRRVLSEDHVDTLQAKHGLATAIYSQGKYAAAVELIRNVLAARTRMLGPEHPETLDSRDGLANCLRNMGRFAEAEELHRKNLEIRLRLLGDKNTNTIASMSNLGDVVAAQGRYHEAYALFRKVMENGRGVLGEEHPDVLRTMYAMSDALAGEGRFAESLDVQMRTLEMRRRVLGLEHPLTHVSMLDVAGLLAELGETGRGELYRETLEWFRTRTASDAADPSDFGAYALLLLNRAHRSLNDTETALKAAQCAVEMSPNLNPSLQDTLARAYHAAGRPNEAVESQRKTLVLFRQVHSPNRAGFESRLGALLVEQQNFAEAEPLLLDSFEWMKEHVECVPERLHEFLLPIVKLYESWDSAEPGKGFGEKAAEYRSLIRSERIGSTKP